MTTTTTQTILVHAIVDQAWMPNYYGYFTDQNQAASLASDLVASGMTEAKVVRKELPLAEGSVCFDTHGASLLAVKKGNVHVLYKYAVDVANWHVFSDLPIGENVAEIQALHVSMKREVRKIRFPKTSIFVGIDGYGHYDKSHKTVIVGVEKTYTITEYLGMEDASSLRLGTHKRGTGNEAPRSKQGPFLAQCEESGEYFLLQGSIGVAYSEVLFSMSRGEYTNHVTLGILEGAESYPIMSFGGGCYYYFPTKEEMELYNSISSPVTPTNSPLVLQVKKNNQ